LFVLNFYYRNGLIARKRLDWHGGMEGGMNMEMMGGRPE